MSMLARYKKGGGIIELVKMIEDSPESKRAALLNMIRTEDAEFAAKVEARLFSYDMIKTLSESIVAEIFASSPVKFVALALTGETDTKFLALVEKCLAANFSEFKSEKELIAAQPPTPAQVDAARKKIVSETRKLEAEGKIKLPFSEGEGAAGGGAKLAAPAPAAAGGGGNATEDNCPPVETFGIEAPPPGLTGERLEQFLKSQLES